MSNFPVVGTRQSSWADESKMTIQERTGYHIGRLSMDVVLGQISRDYFEAKIRQIVQINIEAEREACAQIAHDESHRFDDQSDTFTGLGFQSDLYDLVVENCTMQCEEIARRIRQRGE